MAKEIRTCVFCDGSEIAVPQAPNFYNDYFFSRDVGGVGEYYRDVTNSGFQFSDGTTVAL